MIIFIWGLPGAGKSTIGKITAEELGLSFYEMDDYLPTTFKEKMRAGELITDDDRDSFFKTFANKIYEISLKEDAVISGYVAKERHRKMIREKCDVKLFELVVRKEILIERLKNREDHFFKESTLEKVLKNYEPLVDSIKIDAEKEIPEVIEQIKTHCEK